MRTVTRSVEISRRNQETIMVRTRTRRKGKGKRKGKRERKRERKRRRKRKRKRKKTKERKRKSKEIKPTPLPGAPQGGNKRTPPPIPPHRKITGRSSYLGNLSSIS